MSSSTPPRTPITTRSMRSAVAASSTPNSKLALFGGKKNAATPSRRVSAVGTRKMSTTSTTPRRTSTATALTTSSSSGTPLSKSVSSSNSSTALASGVGDEGIQVAIRMRPLNSNESNHRSVWKVIPKYSSVAQTTPEGQPLPERVTGRTFFTFDKTFAEQSTTADVYNHVVKDIVSSFVTGLNGTVFAYGQTSSGKTYTMQGSGSIQDGAMGTGGIVHMAAHDIFDHIRSKPDRLFLVRASFLEIYNEEVRDLLSAENKTLQIREDPRRGVFVQSVEEVVTDFSSLLEILFRGEKSRAFAATAMNERSSRSHTIFRVTIESRQKTLDDVDGSENTDPNMLDEHDDGAVLISTLNLVDLAGSESVRHTGATGERQKEGGMINQSLLTLSRVIVALGTPNQQHVNFRDSKLTRILQPSLSGNARMAVICCATPSELYLEETRSTLMFASRAKLVKTNAQVNEVLDDRSLIKRLQRELAEAKRHVGTATAAPEHVKELEHKAATAGTAAREAEEKLRRLHASLLNSGVLFGAGGGDVQHKMESSHQVRKRRRLSDGNIAFAISKTPERDLSSSKSPTTLPRAANPGKVIRSKCVSPTSQITLLRDALQAKSMIMKSLQGQLSNAARSVQSKESELIAVSCTNDILRSERDTARENLSQLECELMNHAEQLTEKERKIEEILTTLESELARSQELEETLDALQQEKDAAQIEFETDRNKKNEEIIHLQAELEAANNRNVQLDKSLAVKEEELLKSSSENEELQRQIDSMGNEMDQYRIQVEGLKVERDALRVENEQSKAESAESMKQIESLNLSISGVQKEKEVLIAELERAVADLEDVSQDFQSKASECKDLEGQMVLLRNELDAVKQESQERSVLLEEMDAQMKHEKANSEATIEEQARTLETLQTENESMKSCIQMLEDQIKESTNELSQRTEELSSIRKELETVELKFAELTEVHDRTHKSWESSKNFLEESQQQINVLESRLASSATMIEELRAECIGAKRQLTEATEIVDSKHARIAELEECSSEQLERLSLVENERTLLSDERDVLLSRTDSLQQSNDDLSGQLAEYQSRTESLEAALSETNDRATLLTNERDDLASQLQEKNELISSIENQVALLSGERDSLVSQNELLLESKEALCKQITNLEKITKDMETERNDNLNEMKLLLDERDTLTAQLAECSNRVESVENELASLTLERDSLLLTMTSLQQSDSQLGNQILELQTATSTLQAELTSCQNAVAALTDERDSISRELEAKNDSLAGAEVRLSNLSEEHAALVSEHALLKESNSELENRFFEMRQTTEKLETQMQACRETIAKLTQETESFATQIQLKNEVLERAENELKIMSERYDSLATINAERENGALAIKEKLQDGLKKVELLSEEKEDLVAKTNEMSEQLFSLQHGMTALTTERNDLSHENNRLQESKDHLCNQVSELQSKLETLMGELEQSNQTIQILTEKVESYDSKDQNATDELLLKSVESESLVKQNHSLQEENENLAKQIIELQSRTNAFESEIEQLQQNLSASRESGRKELLDEIQRVSEFHDAAKMELATARHELAQTQAQLNSAKENETLLLSRIEELELQVDSICTEKADLTHRLTESEKDLKSKTDEIVNVFNTLELLNGKIRDLTNQINDLEDELECKERMLSQSLVALEEEKLRSEMTKSDDSQRIESLETELKRMKSQSDFDKNDAARSLQLEIDQLKSLLASSNALVEDTRNAASQLEMELEARDHDIQMLRKFVDEKNAELEQVKRQKHDAKHTGAFSAQLSSELEQAKLENMKLQSDLDKALRSRTEAEEDLRRRMGEEQRALIKEAEATMSELRSRVRTLEESLASAEAEAYAARESSEDFRDQHQQAISRSIQLESKLSSLENECSRLRKSVSRAEQQRETEVSIHVTEITKLKAEKYTIDARLRTLEQAIEAERQEKRNLAAALEAYEGINVHDMREKNESMRARIRTLEKDLDAIVRTKEQLQSEHKALKGNVSALEQEISSKDERIKKLKSLTLTKEQTAALKRLKEERHLYKGKYEAAKKEIAKLKANPAISMAPSDPATNDELTELRFDNEALEKKVRKFAAHTQRLEEEKAKVIQALRSSSVSGQVDANDITAAVTDLCDRLASLEEECDSLSKSDSRVSTLLIEIETLREQNARLTDEMTALQKKAQALDSSVADLKARTSKLQEERESWRQSALQAQDAHAKLELSANEKGRQLRYLEQENLQLMFDLKAMKKQVQSLTDEINMLKQSAEDDTFDLHHSSIRTKSERISAVQTSKRKSPSSPLDKENAGNMLPSASKQRRREISDSSSRKSRPLGLGETLSEANEENTQECTQS